MPGHRHHQPNEGLPGWEPGLADMGALSISTVIEQRLAQASYRVVPQGRVCGKENQDGQPPPGEHLWRPLAPGMPVHLALRFALLQPPIRQDRQPHHAIHVLGRGSQPQHHRRAYQPGIQPGNPSRLVTSLSSSIKDNRQRAGQRGQGLEHDLGSVFGVPGVDRQEKARYRIDHRQRQNLQNA